LRINYTFKETPNFQISDSERKLKENITYNTVRLLIQIRTSAKPLPLPKAFNSNKTADTHISFSIYSGKKEGNPPCPVVFTGKWTNGAPV